MKKISFTLGVKEELCSLSLDSASRKKALLAAYLKSNATIIFRNKQSILNVKSKNAKIARYIYSLLKELYKADVHLQFSTSRSKKTNYLIVVNTLVDEILNDLNISFLEGKVSKNIVYDDDTIAGYLSGLFLACGSVNSPKTSNYHLELLFVQENTAKWVLHLFTRFGNSTFTPKTINRKDKTIIYFKKSDQIADFLLMIGAVSSCMEFENIRIDRDYTNNANRLLNLDTANMDKTIKAGKRQQKEINFLLNKIGLEKIGNKKVQLVVKYRLEFVSAPLDEIASYLSKELNEKVTKSNVNHIFRSIHKKYEDNK